ncbi:MAG: MFS transporter [Halarsenatibacteraceae bacterium]
MADLEVNNDLKSNSKEKSDPKMVKYRRLIWFILAMGYLIGFFHRYTLGIISDILAQEMDLTAVHLGAMTSMYFYAYGFLQAPVGILSDKFGVRIVTTVGLISMGSGSIFFAFSDGMFMASTGRLLIGIGAATFFVSILKMVAVWFPPEAFTKFTGWTALMGNIGALLATTPFSILIGYLSWRQSHVLFGIITYLLAVLAWILVREKPEDKGFEPVNEVEDEERSFLEIIKGMGTLIKSWQFWSYFIIIFTILGGMMSLSGLWLVPYLSHIHDLSRNMAANFALLITSGSILSALLLGYVEKRLGSKIKMLKLTSGVTAVFWIYFVVIQRGFVPLWQLAVLLFLFGTVTLFVMVTFGNVKRLFPELKGSAMGLINLAPFLGTIVFNFLIGWRLDATWAGKVIDGSRIYTIEGYQQSFAIFLIFSVISFILTFQLKRLKKN